MSIAADNSSRLAANGPSPASDNVRWHIEPDWADRLGSLAEVSVDCWLQRHASQVVKDGVHRTVYRVDLGDESLFLKHSRCRSRSQRLANLFRASASRREWDNSRRILSRDLPTAQPVAFGEQLSAGVVRDSYLLTRSIAGSSSFADCLALLDKTLAGDERQAQRNALMCRLAELCARAHQAGVQHDDFHVGNILVQLASGDDVDGARLYMIDLPGIRLGRPLGWRRSRDSLATLITGLLFRCGGDELRTLCREYLAARPELGRPSTDESVREIVRRGRQLARHVLRRRDQRALRTNRHYTMGEFDGTRLHTVANLDPQCVYDAIGDGAAPVRGFIARPWKLTHASVVVEGDLDVSQQATHVAYKRCRVTRLSKLLLAPLRRSRAVDAWYRANALATRGIATPRPLLAIEPPRPTRWRDSYLATEWIPGVANLHLYAWGLAELPEHERLAEANICAERLGRLIGRMHHWGISHRDLKACNLLIAGRGEAIACHVVDPDGVRIRRRITPRRRARDLSRLAASMAAHPWLPSATLMRFLRGYLGEQHDEHVDWKWLWRSIAGQASRAVARKRQRGDIIA